MAGGTQKWSQWDFFSLEDWEVEHCWGYEFTRRLPGLVRRVADWRKKVPKREGRDLFEACLAHQGGRATSFIEIKDNLFLIPLGAYYLFPEWPDTPYLEIPSELRFLRLKKLSEDEKDWLGPRKPGTPESLSESGKHKKECDVAKKGKATSEVREIDPHPAQYRLGPVSYMKTEEQAFYTQWDDDAWERLTQSFKENILRSNKMRAFRSDSEELALFRIPWAQSNKQLLTLFSKWLASNRPIPFQKQGTLGRSHPLPKKRTELEHLRKYLIVQAAGDWKVYVGQRRLFRDRAKWNECEKAVEKIISDLSSYPGCSS